MKRLLALLFIAATAHCQQILFPGTLNGVSGGGGGSQTAIQDTVKLDGRDCWGRLSTYSTPACKGATPTEWFGNDGNSEIPGWQFKLSVPQGSTIDTAIVTYWTTASSDNVAITDTADIQMFSADTAIAWPTTGDTAVGINAWQTLNSTKTAYVAAPDTGMNAYHKTSNFATVLQQVINRAGWVSGNYATVMCYPRATWGSNHEISIYDRNAGTAHPKYIRVVYH